MKLQQKYFIALITTVLLNNESNLRRNSKAELEANSFITLVTEHNTEQ